MACSRSTENFLDMVQMKFEFTAQELANPRLIAQATGLRFATGYDHERYRHFSSDLKKVCELIKTAGLELDEALSIEGLRPEQDGPLMKFVVAAPLVQLFSGDIDIRPMVVITDQGEAAALAYLLTVWQNAWMQHTDPEALLRTRMAEHGIHSWHDFEAQKDRFMIRNPFTPPIGVN